MNVAKYDHLAASFNEGRDDCAMRNRGISNSMQYHGFTFS
jgi:hypothetical protein